MNKGFYLSAILRAPKTVFTAGDIAMLWREQNLNAAKVRLYYYVRKGQLYRIRKGLYAKDKNYNRLELATRIYTPSYVSFETILSKEGMTFQYYKKIFIASYLSRELIIDGQSYNFRKIKNEVLINPIGIYHKEERATASKERAFLDTLYINNDYYFDNINNMDWNKVSEILPIYKNKKMASKVQVLKSKL